MADKDINIGLNVTSNGTTQKETNNAKDLNKELEKAAKAAARIPVAIAAARQGVAASRQKPQVDNSGDSGKARGIGGQTGAEGRDFAKQASGLGGLVHVYATFAANIFALSAAFSALSKAMDTTNMVSGLNQLGAASGRGLGSLAKQLSTVTDGAVSLREAMTATAQASSAGMTSTNILRMGEVAKKTSLALGRDMTDSLSRLSRGITKIEPELLDELGIMVKVDQANQNYARSLGKSASSLSDFEKRQAFANEVLSQAEQKFSNIKLDANPYQKIAASMQNITQTGLELINKVLGPLLNFLSQSPAALATTMAGIATLLIKQAIPALSMFREGLANSAKKADELAAATAKRRKLMYDEKDIDKIAALGAAEKKTAEQIKKAREEYMSVGSGIKAKKATTSMGDSLDNVNEMHTKIYAERLTDVNKQLATEATLNDKKKARLQAESAALTTLVGQTKTLIDTRKALAIEDAKADSPDTFIRKANQQIIAKAQLNAVKSRVVSNAAESFGSLGMSEGFKSLHLEIQNARKGLDALGKPLTDGTAKLGNFGTAALYVKGGLAGLASYIGVVATTLGNIGMIVGIAIAGFEVLDSQLSKNSKEAEKASEALTSMHDAALNMSRTLDAINSKDPLGSISIESITAKATALNELATSFSTLLSSVRAQDKAASGWDRNVVDATKSLFGGGLLKNSAKEVALGLQNAIKALPANSDATTMIKQVLGVDPSDFKAVVEELTNDSSGAKFYAIMDKLAPKLKEVAHESANVASNAAKLEDSFKAAAKTLDTIMVEAMPTDNFAKLGMDMITLGNDMTKAFKDPTTAMSELVSITNDFSKLRVFDPATAKTLISASSEIKKNATELSAFNKVIRAREDELAELQKKREDLLDTADNGVDKIQAPTVHDTKIGQLTASLEQLKAYSDKLQNKMAADMTLVYTAQNNAFARGAVLIENSINIGFQKAAITIAKAISGGVPTDTIAGNALQTSLSNKSVDIELKQLEATKGIIESQYQLRIATEKLANTIDLENLENKRRKSEISDPLYKQQKQALEAKQQGLALEDTGRYTSGKNRANKIREDLSSGTDAEKAAAQGALASSLQLQATQAKIAEKAAEKTANFIKQQLSDIAIVYSIVKENNALSIAELNTKKAVLGIQIANSDYISQETIDKKQILETEIAQKQYLQEQLSIDTLIAQNARALAEYKDKKMSKEADSASKSLDELSARKKRLTDTQTQTELQRLAQVAEEERNFVKKNTDFKIASDKLRFDVLDQRMQARASLEEERINKMKLISADTVGISQSEAELAITKERLKAEQSIQALKTAKATDLAERDRKILSVAPGGDEAKAMEVEKQVSQALYDAKIVSEKLLTEKVLSRLEIQKQLNIEQAKQTEAMDLLVSATESLANVFGKVGSSIGEAGKALLKMAGDENIFSIKRNALAEEYNNIMDNPNMDPKDKHIAEEAYLKSVDKLDKQNAQNQLKNLANVAGASKKMFSEKTFAYKALDAIEKANHIASLARMAEQAVTALMNIGPNIGLGVSKLFAQGGWAGFAGAAAFLALMGSLGFGGGGSVSEPPVGTTAEERQKVQGTGLTYDTNKDSSTYGKTIETGGGVFGDAAAKSESITKSLELLRENSDEGLAGTNTMITLLASIDRSVGNSARSLYTVAGLRVGSAFNTKEGTVKDSGGLISSIFGGNTSVVTEIIDSGVALRGTFTSLANNAEDAISQFERVRTTTNESGGWFGSDDTNIDETTKYLNIADKTVTESISNVFSTATTLFENLGSTIGLSAKEVQGILDNIPVNIDASLRGLKGEELQKELSSVLSSYLDTATLAIFGNIQNLYAKMGEGALETVARITTNNELVIKTLNNIGSSFSETAGSLSKLSGKELKLASISITEDLISLAGGIDNFKANSKAYVNAFFTDSEKLVLSQNKVTETMSELKLTGVTTKEQFRTVIESLDLTTKSGRETYTSLMEVAPAFADVADAVEKLQKDLRSLDIQIMQAKGLGYAATKAQRAEDLNATDDPKLKAKKQELFDAQDASKTRSLEISLMEASGNAVGALAAKRDLEMNNLSDSDKLIQLKIYKEQDLAKVYSLQLETLGALGFTYDALQLQREKELSGLSAEEQLYKRRTYAAQDAAKTENLLIDLLDATGDAEGAVTARRKLELKGLSATDAALKIRIWRLQDEKKLLDTKLSQEAKIYTLLGKAEDALRITRAQELATLDPQLKASQLYIYALEDEATLKDKLKAAYDKESSAIKETVSRTKDFINTLKDYRDSLLLGDKSVLTPAQKYAEAKRQFLQVSAIATNIAITDAQKQAQADAISKLPSVSDSFLEASRNLYASSDTYTNDFNSVLDILDRTSTFIDNQKTEAEKTLLALENQSTIQQIIADNTEGTKTLLEKYLAAVEATATARNAAAVSGSGAAGGTFTAPIAQAVTPTGYIDATGVGWVHGAAGYSGTFAQAQKTLSDAVNEVDAGTMSAADLIAAIRKQGLTSADIDVILGKPAGTASAWALQHGIQGFARGGYAHGLAVVGESGPEVVDFKTPGRVYNNGQTNAMFGTNQELLTEIRNLRKEVEQLRMEQHEQTGHLIKTNYDANNMVAERVATAQVDAANAAEWKNRSRPKLA